MCKRNSNLLYSSISTETFSFFIYWKEPRQYIVVINRKYCHRDQYILEQFPPFHVQIKHFWEILDFIWSITMIFGVFKKLVWKTCTLNWQTKKQPRKVWFVCWHCHIRYILINIWDLLRLTKSQKNLFLFLPHFSVIFFVSFVHALPLRNLINSCRLRIRKIQCSPIYRFRFLYEDDQSTLHLVLEFLEWSTLLVFEFTWKAYFSTSQVLKWLLKLSIEREVEFLWTWWRYANFVS